MTVTCRGGSRDRSCRGWTLVDFFSHKNEKNAHAKSAKMKQKFRKLAQNSQFSGKSNKKWKNSVFFCAPPAKYCNFCRFAPQAQENFRILSLNRRRKAIQNGGLGPDGGASAPLAPPLDPPLLFVQLYCDMNEICTHNSYFLYGLSYSVKAVN